MTLSVFISLVTDQFQRNFSTQAGNTQTQPAGSNWITYGAGASNVRRPLRGLEVKDDTYAILKMIRADGHPVSLVDSSATDGSGSSVANSNFILQSVHEARMEKNQIVETFGESYIFFFGEAPRFLDVSAVLINSFDFNWEAEFWQNYDQYLRGTKAVEQGTRSYLFYDDNVVEGYILQAEASKDSQNPLMVNMTFRMFVTNYTNVSLLNGTANPAYPIRPSVNLPPSVSLTGADISSIGEAALDLASPYQAIDDNNSAYADPSAVQLLQPSSAGGGSGFGIGFSLSASISLGISSGANPMTSVSRGIEQLDGVTADIAAAYGMNTNAQTRMFALRGNIADNTDEYTAGAPTRTTALQDPSVSDVPDLTNAAMQQISFYAYQAQLKQELDSPQTLSDLGLTPIFGVSVGIGIGAGAGVGASASVGASFGVGVGVGTGVNTYGGVNGGMGFTGVYTASPVLAVQAPSPYSPSPLGTASVGFSAGVFGNGVPIQAGIVAGVGIGGGIPGGTGGLTEFQGGTSYSANSYSSSAGYGSGMVGWGASVTVGGNPSAFGTTVVPGTYVNPGSVSTVTYNLNPDGSFSQTNATGLFA